MAQQLLTPGANRTIAVPLEPGRYRLRTLKLQGGQYLQVNSGGLAEVTLRAEPTGWAQDELTLSTNPTLHFENNTSSDQLFVLEHLVWSDQATTAAEVTALQLFRDLFANEALRPGEQISVGTLAVLFTDLRGSTRLYREIGDAPAFGRVMNHFDILKKAISEEEGALVKTIGDAVMAVFLHPAGAVRAMLKAQELLAAEGQPPLCLKAGIHYGPCIAVNLNDRLDYFGSTINLAARLEGFSTGNDVVISAAVRNDPEVIQMLAKSQNQLEAEQFEANLKGFDEERFNLWRVVRSNPILEKSDRKPVQALG
jgi:class 3 adenylate cyclase